MAKKKTSESLIKQTTDIYTPFDGEAAGDRFGYSVNISSNGSKIISGGYANDGNGLNSGHARVFYNEEITYLADGIVETALLYPNPSENGIINILVDNIISIAVFSLDGKVSGCFNSSQIDLSCFEDGIYIVKIITDNEIITKRVVLY